MSRTHDTLEQLLLSGHVTAPTRRVLEERLHRTFERRFFSEAEFRVLQAAAARLVPHDPAHLNLAGVVDDRLAEDRTDGWRYADTPPDPQAMRDLLAALPADFTGLEGPAQDRHLQDLERRFPHPFEDLLAELTEGYYSHPAVQLALGYVGFADAPGWTRIGLNEAERRELAFPGPRDTP
ncbi:gluconate 2-dehydrogenase subunit 3 family protein [Deinococcus sonorensis]|uniref:Gluconate 2-dehydrogenase subunit 3 family protein n=2 Tax=Deinococcus sonorensis TaxID=309891 RepID=A0AAU7UCH7_9DEIO